MQNATKAKCGMAQVHQATRVLDAVSTDTYQIMTMKGTSSTQTDFMVNVYGVTPEELETCSVSTISQDDMMSVSGQPVKHVCAFRVEGNMTHATLMLLANAG